MPRSGTGVYTLPAGNPVVALTKIRTSWANPTLSDIATALTASWARNGEGVALANIPMGGFKFLNVGLATNATDFVRADQVQTSAFGAVTDAANPSANTYTGNLLLGTVLFTAGQLITYNFLATNTGPSTLALNGGTANNILRADGSDLLEGDIQSDVPSLLMWSGIDWLLLSAIGPPFVATGDPTFNTGMGVGALDSLTLGIQNTAVGYLSLSANASGIQNTAIGSGSLILSNADGSTACGAGALSMATTGTFNTALGRLCLSDLVTFTNCTGIGASAQVTGSNQVQLGNASNTTYAYGAVQDRSDARDKADVRDTTLGLAFILRLRPRDFKWDYREDYVEGDAPGARVRKRYHHGFVAQEVPPEFGGYQDHKVKGGKDVLSLGYTEFIAPLVRAVQELSQRVSALEK